MPFGGPNSERVLILAARRRDADVAHQLLAQADFQALICPDATTLMRELRMGAGCIIVTDESLDGSAASMLHGWVQEQPAWSDLPVIVLTSTADGLARSRSTRELQDALGNVSFVERPFHPRTLTSVSRSAMRSRLRQYEARELLERYELLARELQHRTKNLLAVILSIAGASLRKGGDGHETFIERLHALARAQDLLMEGDGRGAHLHDIVQAITNSFGTRIAVEGPQVHLQPTLAQGFALIVHELATNSTKYGALSRDAGSITVRWEVAVGADVSTLQFMWEERGGPLVSPPKRKSFGTVLLERALPSSGGPPRFDYGPQGFGYELFVKLAK